MREARIGQQYRKTDAVNLVWEVIAVAADLNGVRHCYIVDVNDHTNIKLIAEAILMKRRFYQLLAEPVANLETVE